MTEKKLLRQQIKDAVSRLSPQEKAETSVIIEKRIESLPLFAEARTILLFYSLPDEVNTHEWIAHWNGKKRILLPVVKGETLIIRPYSPGEMKPGSFGIAEPTGEDITDLSIIDNCSRSRIRPQRQPAGARERLLRQIAKKDRCALYRCCLRLSDRRVHSRTSARCIHVSDNQQE